MRNKRSPRITHISWGHMEVEGVGKGKDFKLYPGGGHPWEWTETGTQHDPGIQPADVKELIDKGSQIIVLSRGMMFMLKVSPDTLRLLEQKGIRVRVEETVEAVAVYNRLCETDRVGGLFHSTC